MTVLSFIQARELVSTIEQEKTRARVLLDLGLTATNVDINYRFKEVEFSDSKISFKHLNEIANDGEICYYLEKRKSPQKLKIFSADTNLFYKLIPSRDAPTIEISGIKMHRTQERTPWQDTIDKISSLQPLKGRILDTCCCLGYTAITAAKEKDVTQVFTFEKDSNVLEMTDYNPWSRELYLDRKIKLAIGDVNKGIEMFSTAFFDAIVHDPPPFSLSPELYSLDFYKKLFRVLKSSGKIFHYMGNPENEQGKDFVKGVIKRLKEAGFKKIKERPDILGITAQK
ncbi:hypothetical protein CMO88_04820 [Candidatus Woesearchaeota archaeon]|nr:hypothetical protein [Candidatus Woesearchaeota archaeon]|tara:strand:- start:2704 stop:3555 length:852 start_codon:yes stop_codon:yes gene_type:complete